jgi:hypothetical protein
MDMTNYYSAKMNRDLSLGRIICHAMSQFALDIENFKEAFSTDNYATPLVLDNDRYFLGFCKHELKGKTTESTPLYGLLFEANKINP